MDFKKIAETVISLSGGISNISSITHCSTRLRFFIQDKSKVDIDKIKNTKPVLGVVFKGDELQIVLGQNLTPVYSEASKMYNEQGSHAISNIAKTKEKLTAKSVMDIIVGFVSASVTPLIPGLVAGGMMKVFLLLITLVWTPFEKSQAYTLLSMTANVPFYFMPVFVAYGAAKKLGATPLYAMSAAATLVYPDFVALLNGESPVTIFGIPVMIVNYSSTLLPALLIALVAYYCEKILSRVIPGILRSVFVGMLTMTITFTLGITILGPLGDMVGSYIVNIFLFTSEHFGPVAIALLAACMPWLVMTGMHHAVTPFMVQAFADPGYDVFFRPSYILHNMAEGGACIGVGLRAKDKNLKAECFSLAFGCIVAGVTEPAVYGVNFRLKRPMIGVMVGAACGGIIAGIMGATAYVYGYSTILALPIFQDTILAMIVAVIVDIIVAAIVTAILGFDESLIVESKEKSATLTKETVKTTENTISLTEKNISTEPMTVYTPLSGNIIPLKDIPDETFATGILGQGVGIEPSDNVVYAPFHGTVIQVSETKHALGFQSDDGIELLIHVGIDTVNMGGKGFSVQCAVGERVYCGQPVMQFNSDEIRKAGHPTVTAVLVTNSDDYAKFHILRQGNASFTEPLITVEK